MNLTDRKAFYEEIQKKLINGSILHNNRPVNATYTSNAPNNWEDLYFQHNFYLISPDVYNILPLPLTNFLLQLEEYYPIVKQICKYLPFYHLVMVQQIMEPLAVNWVNVATAEIQSRTTHFNWQFASKHLHSSRHDSEVPIIYSKNFFRTNFDNALIFHNGINLNDQVHFSIPQIKWKEQKSFSDFLHNDTTSNMNILSVNIGVRNLRFSHPLSNYRNIRQTYSTLLFPQIPNVFVKQFHFRRKYKYKIDEIVEKDEKIECLLLFTTCMRPAPSIKKLIQYLDETGSKNIPMAGAIVWSLTMQSPDKTQITFESDMYCIAFKANKLKESNFFAASIVIPQENNFEDKVIEFKQNLELRQEDFLLSFICYDKKNSEFEAAILCKHFDCPINQMEVNGELGHNVYTKNQMLENVDLKDRKRKRKLDANDFHHGYTTILVYIGWGNLRIDRNTNGASTSDKK